MNMCQCILSSVGHVIICLTVICFVISIVIMTDVQLFFSSCTAVWCVWCDATDYSSMKREIALEHNTHVPYNFTILLSYGMLTIEF